MGCGWVAQAMWWVAQAMWWEGCAGYVVVSGTFYIHSVVQLAILARFQAKLKFPSWTRVWPQTNTKQDLKHS